MEERDVILEVKHLKQYFKINHKFTVKGVDDISFKIYRGETYGLVGESGSGKTTTGRSIIRLYDATDGEVIFNGKKISGPIDKATRDYLRTNMQMIFQNPMSCLNPRKKVIDIIGEGLDAHHSYKSREEREEKIYAILEKVGLDREHATRFPHQFSGGQRQRIGIARALVMLPQLVIADECISALDVSIQAQVVNLMRDLQDELGITYLFIAHDLSMVKYISDRLGIMHLGHIVETGTTDEIFADPVHPYTRSLLSAILEPNPRVAAAKVPVFYDPGELGIDYTKGTVHALSETHQVLAAEEEFTKWINNSNKGGSL
ncbi:MAG: ATP-binding cassette domain-containing protein [Clostridium sp.]|nr:ATP-binding cassette domain-containing protein [Clostridium sp.]